MRVITPFGFGETEKWGRGPQTVAVLLDQPFIGEKTQTLSRGKDVFPFTDWAVVRVLNIGGRGWFSNIQFHETPADAEMRLLLPTPPDETTFVLDLKSGRLDTSQDLGLLAKDSFLIMRPWLDRWGQERTDLFETRKEALTAFDAELGEMAGATGIATAVLLDVEGKRFLRFSMLVAPPQGVVFNKKYA